MAKEHKSRRELLETIGRIPSLSDLLSMHEGHYSFELDLEVIVYGRNYKGKKVGPYVRLLSFAPGEAITAEGDWGGNTFFILVGGRAEVFVGAANTTEAGGARVAELKPWVQFGEMSILAGVPRNATVKAHHAEPAEILEIQRPALRLLRKLPKFREYLDRTYRSHGKDAAAEDLKSQLGLTSELAEALKKASTFRVFSKNHLLFSEGEPTDAVYLIREGWVRRSVGSAAGRVEDYLGGGFCLGVEGITKNQRWPYTTTVMGRTEVLEIPIGRLRQSMALRSLLGELSRARPSPLPGSPVSRVEARAMLAQQQLIETGLADATNLLVMDMALCVRCGNCSLACHKVHGRSRLVRRGIHVVRPKRPGAKSTQSVLSPEVCMHCKDPECLTGCPTGAIGRFDEGQIDINPKTCIGCGDCATQCPYDAISMVARRPEEDPVKPGLAARIRDLLRIGWNELPKPVVATEDLVAVKCNLCSDRTGLNPPGSPSRKYSCEENCPTGALARINPRQYFEEMGPIQGLLRLDQHMAAGRNIHRSDPPRRWIHLVGTLLSVMAIGWAIAAIVRYGLAEPLAGFLNMRWITGLVGLVGILGVMTYPVRRQIYRRRAGPLRYWVLVHSYLGVIAGAMILLHGGRDSGGALTTALMISYDLVIATGLFGILCYVIVPRLLTRIEGTPLLLDDLKARREELQSEIEETAGSSSERLRHLVKAKVVPRFVSISYLLRQYLIREDLDLMIRSAKEKFHGRNGLGREEQKKLDRAIECAATLRRIDSLIYLHRLLKAWLPPHVAFTSLMLALMIVHIIQVIYYAAG